MSTFYLALLAPDIYNDTRCPAETIPRWACFGWKIPAVLTAISLCPF